MTRQSKQLLRGLGGVALAAFALSSLDARAQDEEPPQPPQTVRLNTTQDPFVGALQTLNAPPQQTPQTGPVEIFPDANRVWMSVAETKGEPIEGARRGITPWLCSSGNCTMNTKELGASRTGDQM